MTTPDQDRLSQLEKLLAFGQDEIMKISIPEPEKDLRLPLLLSNALAVQRLADGVVTLTKDEKPQGISSLLRSMTESFINTKYVMEDDSQMRARAYIVDDHASRIKFTNKVLSSQSGRPDFLGKSLKEWEGLRNELTRELDEMTKRYGKDNLNWLNLWERAQRVKEESMYLTVYWLFSQDSHVTSRGTSKFLEVDEHGNVTFVHDPQLADDVDRYLLTGYSLYLIFLKFCADHFGTPTAESLEPFEEQLKRMAS